MTFIEWLAIAFWPIATLVVISLLYLKRKIWPARQAIFIACALFCLFTLTIILTGVIGHQTAAAIFDWDVYLIAVGLAILALLYFGRRAPAGVKKVAVSILMLTFGFTFAGLGTRDLVGDFLMPPRIVEGNVERAYEEVSRSGWSYHVHINGRHHPTTAEVFVSLRQGERIRAEVGKGSGTIFRAEPF